MALVGSDLTPAGEVSSQVTAVSAQGTEAVGTTQLHVNSSNVGAKVGLAGGRVYKPGKSFNGKNFFSKEWITMHAGGTRAAFEADWTSLGDEKKKEFEVAAKAAKKAARNN
ncbi:hypothetical protein NM688_g8859 [Phlebia brevispora]|uniref:Uncharacterized protein n=1 Tax=Phlebia brevispora TaxID=194682 RepID=A0ACC1RQR5_9APHY|nr:hypothetical protein NM688_g8859 [Phlebia brevispora]